jgi:gamma-glutamylcysteine synthetase
MKKKIFYYSFLSVFFMAMTCQLTIGVAQPEEPENEFVVKKKNKKELAVNVKEDIAAELEFELRQISKNIAELARVQEQIFDKMKDLVGACEDTLDKKSCFSASTQQLKEQRHKLKIFSEKLVRQYEDLQTFLACFK